MNEIRDLIIGIDFGEKNSQICYYNRKAEEARSVSMKVGTEQYEVPTLLCRRPEQGDVCIGLEAAYFAKERGGFLIDNLYEISESEEGVQVAGETAEPSALLASFLQGMLNFLGVMDVIRNIKCLVLTTRTLTQIQVKNLRSACEQLGLREGKYLLMDYGESFYYYVLTQKRETWNRSVGWYDFAGDRVQFHKLVMDGTTRPVSVRLEEQGETQLPALEGAEEEQDEAALHRDREFAQFAEKTLGKELFSSIQITGEGFSQQWAKKSVGILCRQRRKVFLGNNLFAKGACGAGKEKAEDRKLKGYCYLGPSLVLADVGMQMRVMGSPTYYPLIVAGRNWFECRAKCEVLLDDTDELVFLVNQPGEKEKRHVAMALPGLPKRPNKTTRLELILECCSARECRITVKDMGFGEMFPSSGKVWTESVKW